MRAVLDASALLAYLQDEAGSEEVEAVLSEGAISTVNWTEVVQKTLAVGIEVHGLREDLMALGFMVSPFTAEEAEIAGRLWKETRRFGLSLGDRACLSLGLTLGLPVLTTDRVWADLSLALDIRVLR